jgi:hypothetical protein
MSSSTSRTLILILDDSLTTVVPRNHVTSGLGLALHLHFMVISVPLSFGIILGFSMKEGAKPAALSPPGNIRSYEVLETGFRFKAMLMQKLLYWSY